ncbi:MAG: hypothetical protein LBJ94_02300 [Puniceicoccales bacterium]|jgi:hypothetical protein|nr:hypothetical protein [Puniceicoccales bacterium]
MDEISKARQESIITGQEAALLKRFINGNTKNLAKATLRAFNKLDGEAQRVIKSEHALNKRVAKIICADEVSIEASICSLNVKLDAVPNQSRSSKIDGVGGADCRKKSSPNRLLKNKLRRLVRVRRRLRMVREAGIFNKIKNSLGELISKSGDLESGNILSFASNSKKWGEKDAETLKQIFKAFDKLDNDTQVLLMLGCDFNRKHDIIGDKIRAGMIGESDGELLWKLVRLDQVCKEQESGISKQDALCIISHLLRGDSIEDMKASARLAKILGKFSTEMQASFVSYQNFKEHSVGNSSGKRSKRRWDSSSKMGCGKGVEFIQKAIQFNLFLCQLEQIRRGTPIEILVQDNRGGRYFRFR